MCLCAPFWVCSPCERGCTPLNVDTRAWAGTFRCVGPVHVTVLPCTWIQVPVPAIFGVFALCTWLYDPGRGSTCWGSPFSVSSPCSRGSTPVDVDPRGRDGYFWCVCAVYDSERAWTEIHVHGPALFGVFVMCTRLYALGRGSTCLARPFSVCSPCARGCTPLDVDPRAWAGPFMCVRPVYVVVRPWTWIHVA